MVTIHKIVICLCFFQMSIKGMNLSLDPEVLSAVKNDICISTSQESIEVIFRRSQELNKLEREARRLVLVSPTQDVEGVVEKFFYYKHRHATAIKKGELCMGDGDFDSPVSTVSSEDVQRLSDSERAKEAYNYVVALLDRKLDYLVQHETGDRYISFEHCKKRTKDLVIK